MHDKLREALLSRLDDEARTQLHFAAAQHIEATNPSATFDLAYHFDAAGAPDRALPYALAGAELARKQHTLDIAETHYRMAQRSLTTDDHANQLIVHDGLESGNLFGDAMAACSAFLLASAITISRKSGADMGFVPLVTAVIPGVAALFMLPGGTLQVEQPAFILFNGIVMIPLAFWCLATGPRFLSAPEVGMFYLLETVLAPIWVWIIFTERPSNQTLVGGSILTAALLAHSLWQMRSKAKAASLRAAVGAAAG